MKMRSIWLSRVVNLVIQVRDPSATASKAPRQLHQLFPRLILLLRCEHLNRIEGCRKSLQLTNQYLAKKQTERERDWRQSEENQQSLIRWILFGIPWTVDFLYRPLHWSQALYSFHTHRLSSSFRFSSSAFASRGKWSLNPVTTTYKNFTASEL